MLLNIYVTVSPSSIYNLVPVRPSCLEPFIIISTLQSMHSLRNYMVACFVLNNTLMYVSAEWNRHDLASPCCSWQLVAWRYYLSFFWHYMTLSAVTWWRSLWCRSLDSGVTSTQVFEFSFWEGVLPYWMISTMPYHYQSRAEFTQQTVT